jgi:hypothetical protein
MGRNPIDRRHGAMTGAERQARRRERLRKNAHIDGLVEHVERVMKSATATKRNWLLDQLVPLIEQYQEDRERLDRLFAKPRSRIACNRVKSSATAWTKPQSERCGANKQ